ncbi:YARHG domain-containing protein [Tamlana sp. 2_MG-2023]|uniref:YARHG domain-containing protein n=1 Tax=unclassified Tamlana TaxID=2614803 RepID=UPI0026E362BF|nr:MULTISPECIES: YARHG domain-containing protein [unclassified Tamlana]MDO6760310.1 YARHG domain-containing protein [Tamlana sp. 2_MG-2023]MDO6789992.1 YARHG domain-containing protein [Tamlana sp. 1_MG-2023]
MKKLILIITCLLQCSLFANDGAYFASGNQLIPIVESDIEITKEILTVTRKVINGTDYVYVTVDYTFFNSSTAKQLLVGFEAPSPEGDVNGFPKNGRHPYMSDFKVLMNGVLLKHETAMVNSETYYINNKIDAKTEEEIVGEDFNVNNPDFYYVYHFDAKFKSGINKITHTYRFEMSGSVSENYSFDYILTAANRWANHQIDDFTLNIDMGIKQGFDIENTFFNGSADWIIGNGRAISLAHNSTRFITPNGKISFKKENFHPKGELYVSSIDGPLKNYFTSFDFRNHNLPNKIDSNHTATNAVDETAFKILRNLPFAIRGYVFKTKIIQEYFLSQKWYTPNPNYIASLESLLPAEKEWLFTVKQNEWDK